MTDSAVQVANLIARYAELVDAGDFDGLGDLLADAAVGEVGNDSLLVGRDAVRSMFETTTRRYEDGTPGTKHVTTNLILDIDEEAGVAATRSYWTVLQAVPGLPLQPILAGRYHDRFARTDGTWHFAERRYQVELVGDLSHHLLTDIIT